MPTTCPRCLQEQPEGNVQCGACGADLPPGDTVVRPVPASLPPPPEAGGGRCLRCGSAELQAGIIPANSGLSKRLRFKPEGNWVTTYEVKAVACLGCGYVHMMLGLDDCRTMRGR